MMVISARFDELRSEYKDSVGKRFHSEQVPESEKEQPLAQGADGPLRHGAEQSADQTIEVGNEAVEA